MPDTADNKITLKLELEVENSELLEQVDKDIQRLERSLAKVNKELDELEAKQAEYNKELEKANAQAERELETRGAISRETATNIESIKRNIADVDTEMDSLYNKADQYSRVLHEAKFNTEEYAKAKGYIKDATSEVEELKKEVRSASKEASKLSSSFERFFRRLRRIAAAVVIYNVVRRRLADMVKFLWDGARSNEAFVRSLSRVQGNLLTAFQPIYEKIVPALGVLMQWLEGATARIAQFTSFLFGVSVTSSQKAAEALQEQTEATRELDKATKKATGTLASFDTVNVIGSKETEDNSNKIKPDFSTDLESVNDSSWIDKLSNSGFGKGFLNFWKKLKEILTSAWGKTWNFIVDSFNWFIKILDDADPILIETILTTLTIGLAAFLGFTAIKGIVLGIKAGLSTLITFLASNPTTVAITAIGLLATGIYQYNKLKFNQSETGKLVNHLKELTKRLDDSTASLKNFLDETEQIKGDIEGKYGGVKLLAERYFELAEKSSRTDEEDRLLKALAQELVETVPILKDKIDTVTGAYKGTKDEVMALIEQTKELAITQALQERMTEAYKKLFEAEAARDEAETKRRQLEAEGGADALRYWQTAQESDNLGYYAYAWMNYKTTADAYQKSLDSLSEAEKAIAEANKMLAETEARVSGTWGKQPSTPAPPPKLPGVPYKIPGLATGTVVPPNREFYALLGDNTREHEIVSPLSTIRRAVADVMGDQEVTVNVNFGGSLAGLARVLEPAITTERKRTSVFAR